MKKILALFLTIALMLTGCSLTGGSGVTELAAAIYPEISPRPDYESFFDSETGESADVPGKLAHFFSASIPALLTGADGENRVCSPVNVYMALAMLCEVTDGNTRAQLLSLLGADGIEALREQANAVWRANYCDDGVTTSLLANSLWLNKSVPFVQETMDSLAKNYYASSYRGEMGSAALDKALQGWLNEHSGGLLSEQVSGVKTDPRTIMAIVSASYFRAPWVHKYYKEATYEQVFHTAPSGQDITCDFMHQSELKRYYYSEQFSAVPLPLAGSGSMWLILPDEGVSVDALLSDEKAVNFLFSNGGGFDYKDITVNLSMPKFNVASDLDLIPSLKALNVKDVFDSSSSDFSPMTACDDAVYVAQAQHVACVTAGEEGTVAAAFTITEPAVESAPSPDEKTIDFTLDRPFLFAITGPDGLPLFVGVVNRPV